MIFSAFEAAQHPKRADAKKQRDVEVEKNFLNK